MELIRSYEKDYAEKGIVIGDMEYQNEIARRKIERDLEIVEKSVAREEIDASLLRSLNNAELTTLVNYHNEKGADVTTKVYSNQLLDAYNTTKDMERAISNTEETMEVIMDRIDYLKSLLPWYLRIFA